MNTTHDTGIEILQAPASHYGIETQDNHRGDDTHQAQGTPRLVLTQIGISTGCIGCGMTADDEFTHHARQSEQDDTYQIDENEGGATILTCHIRETPYITQTDCRAGCGKNNAQLTTKISSCFHYLNL